VMVMNGVFLWQTSDTWSRLIGGIVSLGMLGVPNAWQNRRELFRIDAFDVAVGLATGLGLYGAARLVCELPVVASEAAKASAWRGDHSFGFLLVTMTMAVVSEELFWRGEITRLFAGATSQVNAVLIATVLFSIAHLGAGNWLLPVAGAAIVLVWGLLFVTTGSLVAPLISHFVFDVFAMLIAPLGAART